MVEQQIANILQQLAGISGEISNIRQIIQDNDTAMKTTVEGEIMLVKQDIIGNIAKEEGEIANIKGVVDQVNIALTGMR